METKQKKSRKSVNNLAATKERRKRVIERLEQQLKDKTKTVGTTKEPLTLQDTKRIDVELTTLKNRI